jgi:YfiH family protein
MNTPTVSLPVSPALELEQPHVFPPHVLAGVTLRNLHLFPPTGLSLLQAQILDEHQVHHHRQVLASHLGTSVEQWRFQRQVHGKRVRVITAQLPKERSDNEESDGLVTQENDIVLAVGMADCAGILFYDPRHKAIAAAHSGWGGTRLNIAEEAIATLHSTYGTQASDLLVYIGPAASGERYEVRHDVAQYFPDSVLRRIDEHRWLFDNRAQIVEQLLACGVQSRNIEVSSGCTIADERYHSHRRDGARAGRMVAFIGLLSR